MEEEGRSLSETPTWAVATVITVLVSVGFLFQGSLKRAGKWSCSVVEQWLVDTKRKALHAALQKIKEELMLFGVLSLLMGHSAIWVSKICVKSSLMDTRFYPCTYDGNYNVSVNQKSVLITSFNSSKYSVSHEQMNTERREHCPEGQEPFAPYESIEQLHRLLFVLGVVHVSYSFGTIALAMLKLYSWRSWESQARAMVIQGLQVCLSGCMPYCAFFWTSMHHSVKISSGTNLYFWLSFTPAIVSTKLHHIVIKLALEVMDANPHAENQFNLRDDLFWFGKPKFLLWLIQLISFQNAFEMATFIWSYWEIRRPSCFMENHAFIVIRLVSGVVFQFWCSFITFPLYVIVTQMGSKFKKSVVTESVRESLHGWRKRAGKKRNGRSYYYLDNATSVTSLDCSPISSSRFEDGSSSHQPVSISVNESGEQESRDENSYVSHTSAPLYDSYSDDDESEKDCQES
ncbi:hypothetical protein IFM89_034021 [Coptis chinensis]|uniref:MLO-like protein n=1 Tax=Coptis chinensis TaxID=261450 RepID=A0A835IRJ1_9MAGN|nr:hypothetical protein IFM89_034021 [Coptis chinensis]